MIDSIDSEKSYKKELNSIFYPENVAVIGASSNESSTGYRYMKNNLDFGFENIYPVNPNDDYIYGQKAYPSILDIEETIDYAIIAVRAEIVPIVLRECVQKSVKVVHIVSGGFSETGSAHGIELENEISNIVNQSETRVIGPNCIGVYNPRANFTHSKRVPSDPGSVSFISHSGGFTIDFECVGMGCGLKFSKCISLGNSIDLDINELLRYLIADHETNIIGMYIEGLDSTKKGRELFELLKYGSKLKPIVILKGGKTSRGKEATLSHTGSLAGNYRVWQSVFKQTNTIEVFSLHEMIDTIQAFINIKHFSGTGTAIIGPGGGRSVTAVDICEEYGFKINRFNDSTISELNDIGYDVSGNLTNPVDVPFSVLGENLDSIPQMINVVSSDPNIDNIVVHMNMNHFMSYRYDHDELDQVVNQIRLANQEVSETIIAVLRNTSTPKLFDIYYNQRNNSIKHPLSIYNSLESAIVSLQHISNYSARNN